MLGVKAARPVATPCLALSLGPVVGVGLRWDAARVGSGVESFVLRPNESPGHRAQRFQAWIRDLLALAEPGLVAYAPPADPPRVVRRDDGWTLAQEALLLAELEGRANHVAVPLAEVGRHLSYEGDLTPTGWKRAAEAQWRRAPTHLKEAEALGLLTWAFDAIGEELIP